MVLATADPFGVCRPTSVELEGEVNRSGSVPGASARWGLFLDCEGTPMGSAFPADGSSTAPSMLGDFPSEIEFDGLPNSEGGDAGGSGALTTGGSDRRALDPVPQDESDLGVPVGSTIAAGAGVESSLTMSSASFLLGAKSFADVASSRTPVSFSPWAFWKARSAEDDFLPHTPSTAPSLKPKLTSACCTCLGDRLHSCASAGLCRRKQKIANAAQTAPSVLTIAPLGMEVYTVRW